MAFGWARAAWICAVAAALARSSSAGSQRGSSSISSTRSRVASRLRDRVRPEITKRSSPAETLTAAPSDLKAFSSSAGVRLRVPRSIIRASRPAAPGFAGSSNRRPPSIDSSKYASGVSLFSMPETARPLGSAAFQMVGEATTAGSPNAGSTVRSKVEGVRA